jgi:hypothetical protein
LVGKKIRKEGITSLPTSFKGFPIELPGFDTTMLQLFKIAGLFDHLMTTYYLYKSKGRTLFVAMFSPPKKARPFEE